MNKPEVKKYPDGVFYFTILTRSPKRLALAVMGVANAKVTETLDNKDSWN